MIDTGRYFIRSPWEVYRKMNDLDTEAKAKLAPTKTKREARYRDQPMGKQRCDLCSMYVRGNACTKVQGRISAAGWCKYFEWSAQSRTSNLRGHKESESKPA